MATSWSTISTTYIKHRSKINSLSEMKYIMSNVNILTLSQFSGFIAEYWWSEAVTWTVTTVGGGAGDLSIATLPA